jgi:hypothetical protein
MGPTGATTGCSAFWSETEKPFGTTFTERDYVRVRQLGEEYRSRAPRAVLR